MRLIDQHVKSLMEDCKKKSRDFGLQFDDETLEYIVSNQDLIELEPKVMIPTHYDFWMHDLQVHYGRGKYQLYPHNPYETVINTRPSISFYNNDNPDWMNKAIFYHVLGHQDFFQNNQFFSHTWNDDLCGLALAQKRRINEIRKELGEEKRYVDYIIEFTRQIDNLINLFVRLREQEVERKKKSKIDFYFSDFLRERDLTTHEYLREIEEYNELVREYGEENSVISFLKSIKSKHPEFESEYKKYLDKSNKRQDDIVDFLINNSPKITKFGNEWMSEVMQIVKTMSLYLAPQMHTKILNEGWATFVHNQLFLNDEYLSSHEADFARFNARVTQTPKLGLNPYALGYDLLEYIRELGDKGKIGYEFQRVKNYHERKEYDKKTGSGLDTLFEIRKKLDDNLFLNYLDENNFQEFIDYNKLYVASKKLNLQTMKWEFYIKSRKAEDYRNMVLDKLPHPPNIEYYIDEKMSLVLDHKFEGKQLYKPFIENVLRGLSYLWEGPISLYTTEFDVKSNEDIIKWYQGEEINFRTKRVRYNIDDFRSTLKRSELRVED